MMDQKLFTVGQPRTRIKAALSFEGFDNEYWDLVTIVHGKFNLEYELCGYLGSPNLFLVKTWDILYNRDRYKYDRVYIDAYSKYLELCTIFKLDRAGIARRSGLTDPSEYNSLFYRCCNMIEMMNVLESRDWSCRL